MPRVYRGKRGVSYVKTAGGNTVGVKMDGEGRLYMFDRAGNLYYDTGDARLGFYIVRAAPGCYPNVHCTRWKDCTLSSHLGLHLTATPMSVNEWQRSHVI
jgi:hypothetical protein